MKNRVVITGLGVISPNAEDKEDFRQAIKEGRSGIRFIQRLEELKFACRIAGVPQNFDTTVQKYFSKKVLASLSENIGYASVAAFEAWKDAGLTVSEEDGEADWDSGTIMGCGICDMEIIATKVVPVVNSGKVRRLGSRVIEQVMASGTSARIAGMLGLGNQATSNSSACSTGTEAIVEAAWKIKSGRAKRMIAGGSEGPSPYTWGGFDSMRVLSSKFNDTPEKGSRPMSATANGFVPGSGAGALVLEDLDTALARGSKIYAEIIGTNVNCGGQRSGGSMTAPNPEGVQRCIQGALDEAGIHPSDIDAINGHLTATYADPHEINNWAEALDLNPHDFPYTNATKSMIGHCLGAAGAIETVAAAIQLHEGFLHPSINCEDIHPELERYTDRIVRSYMEMPDMKIMAKASFGFGDVNSCLILKKWENN